MILCIFIPYFTATILHREADLDEGTPLAVLRRTRISTTNASAEREGALIGLTKRQAKALHPEVVFVPEDDAVLGRILNQILDSLSAFSPIIEYTDPQPKKRSSQITLRDTRQSAIFYLDLAHLNGSASERLMTQVQTALREAVGLEATIGLASTKFVAFVACCCTPLSQTRAIPAGGDVAFLAPQSVNLLPADDKTLRRLQAQGAKSLGQVGALPLNALVAQFGQRGFLFHRLVRAQDNLPVRQHRFSVVEQVACEFDAPLSDQNQIEAVLQTLAVDVSSRLQSKGKMGRTFRLTLHLENGEQLQTEQTLRRAASGTVAITKKLLQLLPSMKNIPGGIVAIEVVVSQIVPFAGQQLELFNPEANSRERLKQALGDLTVRYNAECYKWIQPFRQENKNPLSRVNK